MVSEEGEEGPERERESEGRGTRRERRLTYFYTNECYYQSRQH